MPTFQVNTKWAAMSEVVPGLHISGVSALKPADIQEKKIKCIINATNEVPNLQIPEIDRMKLWISDTNKEDISGLFHVVADHVNSSVRQRRNVLVHCVAGVSRSAALCLAYLVKYQNTTLRQAYHLMSAKREMVRPNLGFWRQLIEFEKDVKDGNSTVRFVETVSPEDGSRQCLPDVYFPIVLRSRQQKMEKNNGGVGNDGCENKSTTTEVEKENSPPAQKLFAEGRERRYSGEKIKFVPKLDPLPEIEP